MRTPRLTLAARARRERRSRACCIYFHLHSPDIAEADCERAQVNVTLRVDPVGAGYFVRGTALLAPPLRRACACCGGPVEVTLENEFEIWCARARARVGHAPYRRVTQRVPFSQADGQAGAAHQPRAAPRRCTRRRRARGTRARGLGDAALSSSRILRRPHARHPRQLAACASGSAALRRRALRRRGRREARRQRRQRGGARCCLGGALVCAGRAAETHGGHRRRNLTISRSRWREAPTPTPRA